MRLTRNQARLLRFWINFPEWSIVQEDAKKDVLYLVDCGFLDYDWIGRLARLHQFMSHLPTND